MNHIKQHRPGWISGWEDDEVDFDSEDELLSIPFVARFATRPDFYRYSFCLSETEKYAGALMAEYNEGKKWWVIGYLTKAINLPKWKPVYK